MNEIGPPHWDDLPALAAMAEQLQDRAQGEAARRILGCHAAIWRAVVRREPFPRPSAHRTEIRLALAEALAAASPADRPRVAALVWNYQPVTGSETDAPRIGQFHLARLQSRAERAARAA